jgi:hypothetical protein
MDLIQKWSNPKLGKLSIANIENEITRKVMADLLENQETKNINQELLLEADFNTTTPTTQANGQFQPIALAMVRRTFPELFATKVVPTQAMKGPVGLAYALRFVYEGYENSEAAFNRVNVFSGFTGSTSGTSGTADAGTGVALNTAEAWYMGNPTVTGNMPQLKLILAKAAIEAKTRKLAASFSLEAAQDIRAMHGLDIEKEMVDVLHYEVLAEMDREIVAALKAAAVDTSVGGEAATALDVSASDGRWSQEKFSNVANAIIKKANDIATSTFKAAGNFAIVSNSVATALQALNSKIFTAIDSNVNATGTMAKVGRLNGAIDIYRDPYATSDYALIGYKGPGQNDGGIVYSPYIMGLTAKATSDQSFSPKICVMSRYAITASLLNSGRYYRQINFSNLSSVIGA